jgi:origin recognition complex subunit 1
VYYNGFMRIIEDKRASRGKGKSKEKIAQLMFRVGDGVLIGTVGDVGVAVLTRLWEQPVEEDGDEDEMEDDDSEQVKMEKMCEIRWCYRKKDLPGVIGKIQLSDVSWVSRCRHSH